MMQVKEPGSKTSPAQLTSARNADWEEFFIGVGFVALGCNRDYT
ncbi:hypothetical protein [Lacrimispora sp.]